jgi:hypothetical protein
MSLWPPDDVSHDPQHHQDEKPPGGEPGGQWCFAFNPCRWQAA